MEIIFFLILGGIFLLILAGITKALESKNFPFRLSLQRKGKRFDYFNGNH